ncbi:MAG: AraC family transcriptional regulator [Aestuariivirga sp.]|nr:AraC family transcriptional regulator [Aestuariivirga sp.]
MKLLAPDDTLDDLAANDETSFWRVNRHESLECLSATFRTHIFPPHTHETYVVGAVVSGLHVYNIEGSLVRAGVGDLCFINPGEVHDTVLQKGGYSYRVIYPRASLLQTVIEMATGRQACAPQFNGPVIRDQSLATRFLQAHEALENGAEPLAADEALTAVLLDMIDRHGGGLRAMAAGHEPAAVRRAKDYLAAHVDEQVDLEVLARAAGLSPFHLIRVFRKATGLTPHNWLMDQRVHLACNLLRAGMSATHVAAQCGFADQSHLTRVFKSRLGITPGRFRLSKDCA